MAALRHLLVVSLLLLLATPSLATPAPSPASGRVVVQVEGLHNTRGRLQVALFRSADGFPDAPQRAFARRVTAIEGGTALVEFDGVPPGEVAVLAHHDEDADGKMRRKLFGQPAEGYAVSRD